MQIKSFFQKNLEGIKKGFFRFPLAIISAIALTSILVYGEFIGNIDAYEIIDSNMRNILDRVFTVSIFLFASISLLNEFLSTRTDKKNYKIISNIIGFALAILLFFYTKNSPSLFSGKISIIIPGLVIIFILMSLIWGGIGNPKNLEHFIYEIIKATLISILFSGAIFVGVELILFALSTLFFSQIDSRFYVSAGYIILITINLLIFLSYFPRIDDLDNIDIPAFLRILIGNIITVLVSIFGVILYIYFIMILIQRQMPVNMISYLVIIFGSASVTLLILLNLIKRNTFTKIFTMALPALIVPLTILMFFSMWTRINDYGFTERRYYVIVIGIWILLSVLYFLINRYKNNIPIFATFAILTLISIIGPISAYNISLNSQVGRLEEYLTRNDMLIDGKIQPNENINPEDKSQISSILQYFEYRKNVEDIKFINKIGQDFFQNPVKYLGFDFRYNYPFPDKGISFFREYTTIDNISDYNKIHKFNIFNKSSFEGFEFLVKDESFVIRYGGDEKLISFENIKEKLSTLEENSNLEFDFKLNNKDMKIVFIDLYYYDSPESLSGTILLLEK